VKATKLQTERTPDQEFWSSNVLVDFPDHPRMVPASFVNIAPEDAKAGLAWKVLTPKPLAGYSIIKTHTGWKAILKGGT
jgi:hypothetical protein